MAIPASFFFIPLWAFAIYNGYLNDFDFDNYDYWEWTNISEHWWGIPWFLIFIASYNYCTAAVMNFTRQKDKVKPAFVLASISFIISRTFRYMGLSMFILFLVGSTLGSLYLPTAIVGIILSAFTTFSIIAIDPVVANVVADEEESFLSSLVTIVQVVKRKFLELIYTRFLHKALIILINILFFIPVTFLSSIVLSLSMNRILASIGYLTLVIFLNIICNTYILSVENIYLSKVYSLAKEEIENESFDDENIEQNESEEEPLDLPPYLSETEELELISPSESPRNVFLGFDLETKEVIDKDKNIW